MRAGPSKNSPQKRKGESISVVSCPAKSAVKKTKVTDSRKEIDDLFLAASKNKKRQSVEQAAKASPIGPAHTGKALPKLIGSKEDLFGQGHSSLRRRDDEGLPIYTSDELNVGKGGDTGDCPFDCKCCF